MTNRTLYLGIAAFVAALAACKDNPAAPDLSFLPVCAIGGSDWTVQPSAATLADLAPTGVLRVGVLVSNVNNATVDSATHTTSGPAADLACKLARAAQVRLKLIPYTTAPLLETGVTNGEWDVAFAFDPTISNPTILTAAPHLAVENTYLVSPTSSFQVVADVDVAGTRIAVANGGATDIFLTALIMHATIVRAATPAAALNLLRTGNADAFAGNRSVESAYITSSLPGARMLKDDLFTVKLAIALPAGHTLGLAYANSFVAWAKSSGLTQQAVTNAGLIGVVVP